MAASVSVSNAKIGQAATISVSGDANNTSRVVTITHPDGSTETKKVTTNGSGAASVTYVPQVVGKATVNLDPMPTASGATATTTVNHSH